MKNKKEQRTWKPGSQEYSVEKLYSHGVENYGDFHNGYLNFGLWEKGNELYVDAAQNLVRRMGVMLGLNQESKLLDVGPGMGTQDIYLVQNFGPSSIHAVDVTWKHIKHARQRAAEARLPQIHYHHGTATNLPFKNSSFTHLLSIEAPEHFDTREQFMREARRVLKPGGVIAMADFVVKKKPVTLRERFLSEAVRSAWKVPRANVYSSDVYEEKMSAAGFANIQIEEMGHSVIPGYYFEQRRPEIVRAVRNIRGRLVTRLSLLLDLLVYQAYLMGLVEYVLVRAETI